MNLYSLQFVFFLVAALVAYYAVGRFAKRYQWIVLLVASLGFYFYTGWQNMFFILFTALSTWAVSRAFGTLDAQADELRKQASDREQKKLIKQRFKHRKWLVLLGALVVNFGVLGYVKYWNVLLGYLGAGDSFLASRLLLPLGISFYTFQSIGYLIDCYNGKFPPERNFARYLLFVSWFPQLIQGPINRFDELAHQLTAHNRPSWKNMRHGLLLVGYGMLKKYVIADLLAGIIAASLDSIDPSTPGSVIVFGILLYTIQQYGDFSGGIDMVRGVSHMFGITLAQNFNQPYFATSLADFWRRWHITLGAWMRDYVFYPLAVRPSLLKLNKWGTAHLGKHVGRTLSACIGNIVVFLLVGVWHGAELHYVLWGLYQGVVIAASDMLRPAFDKLSGALHVNTESAGYHVFAILRTFFLVNIGRYFDRLTDGGDLLLAFRNSIAHFDIGQFGAWFQVHSVAHMPECLLFAGLGCIVVFVVSLRRERGMRVSAEWLALPAAVRVASYIALVLAVVSSFFLASSTGGFLYANF